MSRLIFLHIEKGAGTSIRTLFYNEIGKHNVYWFGKNPDLKDEYSSFWLAGGHKPISFYTNGEENNLLYVAVVRFPISRIISLFNYYVSKNIVKMTSANGFDSESLSNTVFNCERFRNLIRNRQCRYLSGTESFTEVEKVLKNEEFFIGSFEKLVYFEKELIQKLNFETSLPQANEGIKGYEEKFNLSEELRHELTSLLSEDQKLYDFVNSQNQGIFSTVKNTTWNELKKEVDGLKSKALTEEYYGKFFLQDIPTELKVSSTIKLNFVLKNLSSYNWFNTDKTLKISYHWLNDNDEVVCFEGARSPLGFDFIPQDQSIDVQAVVKSPSTIGKYKLQLTLLKEKYAWLENKGFQLSEVLIYVGQN